MLDDLPLTPPVPLWNDLMLRFSDKAEATEQLLAAGLLIEFKTQESAGYAPSPGAAVDTVGVIYKPTGNTIITSMGEQPEMAPLPGWHVNVRLKADHLVPELESYKVTPAQPVRVWAS
jgi:hypothetical protein